MRKIIFSFFLLLFSLMTFAQSSKSTFELGYFSDYPSEIDGGCTGYYLSQEDMSNNKILMADDFVSAFIKINGKREVLQLQKGSTENKQVFSNDSYSLIVLISEQKKISEEQYSLKGTITIKSVKGESTTFPFIGEREW